AHASPDDPNGIIVQEHSSSKSSRGWIRLLQILVIIVFIAVVVLDLLIDSGVMANPGNLPVTHFFNK
ncbi:MAG: hypothetical protein ACREGF_05195, partial [Candidatus Saccharimonadales bacterium]